MNLQIALLVLSVLVVSFGLVLLPRHESFGDEPPAKPAGEMTFDEWPIRLWYGINAPQDFPIGISNAIFDKGGRVTIDSMDRSSRRSMIGLHALRIYENDDLLPELRQLFLTAANHAIQEQPVKINQSHYPFFRLDSMGRGARHVYHGVDEFHNAPPAMKKFVSLINGLLPREERVALKPDSPPAPTVRIGDPLQKPPEWTVTIRVDSSFAVPENVWRLAPKTEFVAQPSLLAQFSADGQAKVTRDGTVVYENDALAEEDLAILRQLVDMAGKGLGGVSRMNEGLETRTDEGLAIRVRNYNARGDTEKAHYEGRLKRYGDASPPMVNIVHWINDHLPKFARVDLTPAK